MIRARNFAVNFILSPYSVLFAVNRARILPIYRTLNLSGNGLNSTLVKLTASKSLGWGVVLEGILLKTFFHFIDI